MIQGLGNDALDPKAPKYRSFTAYVSFGKVLFYLQTLGVIL